MKGQAELYKAWKKARTTLAPPSKIQVFGAAYELGKAWRQAEKDLLPDRLDELTKENQKLKAELNTAESTLFFILDSPDPAETVKALKHAMNTAKSQA